MQIYRERDGKEPVVLVSFPWEDIKQIVKKGRDLGLLTIDCDPSICAFEVILGRLVQPKEDN